MIRVINNWWIIRINKLKNKIRIQINYMYL